MKVLFIVYHDLNYEARSQEILEIAKKIGTTVLVTQSKLSYDKNIKVYSTDRRKKYLKFLYLALRAIKKEDPDIVFLHDSATAPLLPILLKNKKTKIVYDSSELYIDRKITSFKTVVSYINRKIEKKYLSKVNVNIAANIERAELMREYFSLPNMPVIFENIHQIEEAYDKDKCNQKYKDLIDQNKFTILYAGGVSKERLTYELSKDMGRLGENYQLLIVGRITEKDKTGFPIFLKALEIKNVHYIGFVSRSELRFLMNISNINVSIFEQTKLNNKFCASGKLYEGLFEGIPVLTSTNPPFRRLCEDYEIGISTNDFFSGIKTIESNYSKYVENVKRFIDSLDRKKILDDTAQKIIKELGIY